MNRSNIIGLVTCIIILLSSCSKRMNFTLYEIPQLSASTNKTPASCYDEAAYRIDEQIPNSNVVYKIKLYFHMIDGPRGKNNFSYEEARNYFWLLVENANLRLNQNEAMKLPIGNKTPKILPLIQYQMHDNFKLSKPTAYYHHREPDERIAYFLNKGADQNNYSMDIINKYAIDNDSVLNVFIMSFPPDSMKSRGNEYYGSGIALGNNIKLGGLYQKGGPEWGYATMFNHEVGHVLNLAHSWGSDGCGDTPNHENCYSDNTGPCTGTLASNNMMDYNNSQMAITPCQIGTMRKALATNGNPQRGTLTFDFCEKDVKDIILIDKEVAWLGEKDVNKDIYIAKGGKLTICCRLSLPRDGQIVVEPGGELILNQVKLENACGYPIEGVIVGKLKGKKGIVTVK